MNTRSSCPNPDCKDGIVYVCNAYASDPLTPMPEPCDICQGHGIVSSDSNVPLEN